MKTLDQIFIEKGTDKSSLSHNYSPYYEMFFGPLRNEPLSIMELGVYSGASVRAWKEYFPNANIFGVDVTYHPQINEDRVFMIEADLSKQEDIDRLSVVPYDIIVDDAAHRGDHQVACFRTLFQSLKPGGLYIIEDILCSYDERWNDPINFMDFLRTLPGAVQMNGKVPGSRLCANKSEQVKLYPTDDCLERHVEFVFVAMGIVFIKKMA